MCICVCEPWLVWSGVGGRRRTAMWLSRRNSSTYPSISHLKKRDSAPCLFSPLTHDDNCLTDWAHAVYMFLCFQFFPPTQPNPYSVTFVITDCVSKWCGLYWGLEVQTPLGPPVLRDTMMLWSTLHEYFHRGPQEKWSKAEASKSKPHGVIWHFVIEFMSYGCYYISVFVCLSVCLCMGSICWSYLAALHTTAGFLFVSSSQWPLLTSP